MTEDTAITLPRPPVVNIRPARPEDIDQLSS